MCLVCEISSSHNGECKDGCLKGCRVVLMMEAARSSETSVNIYQTTRRNIPESSHHTLMRFRKATAL
jgi:hypothetical protein